MATVLLGEIDDDVREAFTLLFRRAGYRVVSAVHPPAILETAVRERPDLVILNLREEDGPEMCRTLRAEPRTRATPILLLTADLYPDADTALESGADAFLPKPVLNDDLLRQAGMLITTGAGAEPGAEPA